jgi:hypothetical protein
LLRNEAVDPEAIAAGGFKASVAAARECTAVLAVEDTTTLSYAHAVREELGDLGGPSEGHKRGFHVHSVLLLDACSGRTLGLGAQQRWCRDARRRGQRHRRRERRYEDKESFKWQRASQQLRTRMGEETMKRVISVCDREADVFEYLEYKRSQGERFVVRGQWDRRTTGEARRLFEQVQAAPVLGTRQVQITQRGSRRARVARVELRGCQVQLHEVLDDTLEPHCEPADPKPRRCDELLAALEWQVLWLTHENGKPVPEFAPELRWAYEALAKLGGWIDTKRTGRAGWKALWEGWFRLSERVDAARLVQQHTSSLQM